MNLFVLDDDLVLNAQSHVDSHVVKMPLEAAQLACTALWRHGVEAHYKKTHENHPCAKWTRKTRSNYVWTIQYGLTLCAEYTHRYGKIHKCQAVLEDCLNKRESIPDGELTTHAQAMAEGFQRPTAIEAYRNYYREAKRHLAVWSKRETPIWWNMS